MTESQELAMLAAERAMAYTGAMFRDLILNGRKMNICDTDIITTLLYCCEKQMQGYEDETMELMKICNKNYQDYKAKADDPS